MAEDPTPRSDADIAAALVRLEDATTRRPGFGRATHVATTTLSGGLRCHSEEGPWSVDADLPGGLGGTGTAPSPGVLLRAALGSCLAMGYRLRAARHGVAVGAIRVRVEADSELDGMLRTASSAPPGFGELRYHVELDTDAPPDVVAAIVEEADRLSPLLDAVGRANRLARTVTVVAEAR